MEFILFIVGGQDDCRVHQQGAGQPSDGSRPRDTSVGLHRELSQHHIKGQIQGKYIELHSLYHSKD